MDLVLFNAAMEHVCRISRIVSQPAGNAMLIGVGGSGKQSLARLGSFIAGLETRQLAVTGAFKVSDLKEAIQEMYKTAGVKGIPTTFLMTDSQIVNDEFLIYLSGMLATGWVGDLFLKEDIDAILGAIGGEAKSAGIPDLYEARLNFFIKRVRANLHIVLAFSPVGDTFRIRARRFPALVNCTCADYFHGWPRQALISVANKFLEDVELGTPEIKENLAIHMAEEHLSVQEVSTAYLQVQRRYNYVTPKSFLELIGFYKYLLGEKRAEVQANIERLDTGLQTIAKVSKDVAELQKDLIQTMKVVGEKKEATALLLEKIAVEQEGADIEKAKASDVAINANAASAAAAEIKAVASVELEAAEPAMREAADAVDCLEASMLNELKALKKAPKDCEFVTGVCICLLQHQTSKKKMEDWPTAQKMMNNAAAFKQELIDFGTESEPDAGDAPVMTIPDNEVVAVERYLVDWVDDDGNKLFTKAYFMKKSAAAANLATWVIATYTFNRIYVKVRGWGERRAATARRR